MGLFRGQATAHQIERRSTARYRLDCPAQLRMSMGARRGSLYDISQDGARFTTDDPPPSGTSGLLEWGTHEAFGKVIWVNEQGCGFEFERPLPREVLESMTTVATAPSGPVANFGNIPVASKRRRGLVSPD